MDLSKTHILASRPSDSLQWTLPEKIAPIVWRFDLGLEDPFFPIEDPLCFQALTLGLKKFTQEVWPHYQEVTKGAILYQGSADFSECFQWTEKQKENWNLWLEERGEGDERELRRLFCADAYAHYFQMLAHQLPDELSLYLLFDSAGIGSLAHRYQLLSKERFEHFLVAVKGLDHFNGLIWTGETVQLAPLSSEALCFPEERKCDSAILHRLNDWMNHHPHPFRVLLEAFLTEDWEGVDRLYVLKESLTVQGVRKLKGFEAAGGTIIYI